MQKSLGICLLCMMLMLSTVFVSTTLPLVSALDLGTSVNSISPYWKNAVPEVNIRATVNIGTADNITLYYRYSSNNASWNSWQKWIGVHNPDSCTPWAWNFNCPSETGYYEFYSIGANSGIYEVAPTVADARCHVNVSVWARFGYEHAGDYSNELDKSDPVYKKNVIQGSNFTCPSDGVANNMNVYLTNWGSTAHVKCAIYYSDNGSRVGYTEEKDIGNVAEWITFNFIGEPHLVAGTKYLLVVWGDAAYLHYDDDITNNFNGYPLNYTDAFPLSIVGLLHIQDYVVSIYCRYTEYEPNDPPNTPSNPNPANHATSVGINADLSWIGGDQNSNDIVTYDIYFGTASSPPLKKSGHTITIYDPGTLSSNTKYYWKIVAKDNHGAPTTGPIWDFTTVNVNQPPNKPYNPTPQNGTIDINIAQDLSWSGGDLDVNDTVTYDVYFGSILPLQKVASHIYLPGYNPGLLINGLTYFWYVVARDNHGLSTNGPVWHFTTINATNNPPNKPTINGEINGKRGIEYEYKFVSTDPEEDNITYCVNWGDDTTEVWIGPYPSGVQASAKHTWSEKGEYTIKAKTRDVFGAESYWATFEVSMPKTHLYNPIMQLLLRILERFPLLEKILNLYYN